uniref:AA_permease domain-containing protein n=1 Tax=Heligmosomoides polygyrus TaxID=6339 RepID=A0A183G8K0_HELPZ
LLGVLVFGASVSEMFIRDKYGQSAMGKLTISEVAWPFPVVILWGCLGATIGAGMQSLTGAPRLLQAIASGTFLRFLVLSFSAVNSITAGQERIRTVPHIRFGPMPKRTVWSVPKRFSK